MLLSGGSPSADELTSEVWPTLPEWRAVLSLKEHIAASQAGSAFVLALGGGIATLVLALLTILTWRNVQQQLKRAQLQEEITATVSHELRTPLSSMRLLVESLLEEDTPDTAKTREYLELIARENTRLSRMIENFLTLARLERGKSAPAQRITVREIIDRISQAANDAGHGKRLRIAPELPEASVEIDAAALDVALLNLIDNACKYSPADQLVELSASIDNSHLVFSVRDHGAGLSPSELQRIWLPFERLHTSPQPGCGLGLAIVQRIARQAGGSVDAESAPGKGSTFDLRLPIA
jgi:signal transduction histidine kinase